MTREADFEIDAAKLAAELSHEEERRRAAPVMWRIRRWLIYSVTTGIAFVGGPALFSEDGAAALDPANPGLWTRIAVAIVTVTVVIALEDRRTPKSADDVQAAADRLKKEIEQESGEGWRMRTLRTGVRMGLFIGIPVGLLLALSQFGEGVTWYQRLGALAGFIGLTFLWTIPMAFVIRWLSMRSVRKYRVTR